jgi:hypothetical protein
MPVDFPSVRFGTMPSSTYVIGKHEGTQSGKSKYGNPIAESNSALKRIREAIRSDQEKLFSNFITCFFRGKKKTSSFGCSFIPL